VRVPGGATNGMARVRVNIPGWDGIDLANPSFEFKTEDGRQSPGELIQPPKEIQIKCGCLKSPVPEPNAIERRSMATSREKN
jgi:hypothetical protein